MKSMGSLRGGAPDNSREGDGVGRGGRQPSPHKKIPPSFFYIHISKYPSANINTNSYQSNQKSITLKSMTWWSKMINSIFVNFLVIRLVTYCNLSHSLFNPNICSLVPSRILQVEQERNGFKFRMYEKLKKIENACARARFGMQR